MDSVLSESICLKANATVSAWNWNRQTNATFGPDTLQAHPFDKYTMDITALLSILGWKTVGEETTLISKLVRREVSYSTQ